ncbi:MAG: hypothetical protein IKZ95_07840 [Lachnospiraceae bacterium]|nr:hypothetical protein [Lachnospiraceae bacterium]
MEDRSFPDIEIRLNPHLVRVVNDDALIGTLREGKHKAAFLLAHKILKDYQEEYGEELKITEKSLACEIYWHYYFLDKATAFERRFGKKKFTSWLIRHIDTSDCGERKVDNNRFVWDLLSHFF